MTVRDMITALTNLGADDAELYQMVKFQNGLTIKAPVQNLSLDKMAMFECSPYLVLKDINFGNGLILDMQDVTVPRKVYKPVAIEGNIAIYHRVELTYAES